MTWDEVLADPCLQDLPYKIELNKRGHVEMSPAKARHAKFQGKIANLLGAMKPDGYVLPEVPIRTTDNVKVPDVAWVSFARYDAAAEPDELYTDTAPEICVEIVSPSSAPADLLDKGQLYLQAGAEEFWLCNELGDVQFFDVSGPLEHSRLCPEFPTKIEFRR